MKTNNMSPIQKYALSLSAPILVTGSDPNYDKPKFDPPSEVRQMLSSWWDIDSLEGLEEALHWLDEEGGHTAVYLQTHHRLKEMLHCERLDYVASLESEDEDEYLRAALVHHYLHDLGRYTIRAFDLARYCMLVRAGYILEWFSEEKMWSLSLKQAQTIIDNRMFGSHIDFLYSYYVGRAFGMKLGSDGIKKSLFNARKLLIEANSPFLSWAPWPSPGAESQSSGGGQ